MFSKQVFSVALFLAFTQMINGQQKCRTPSGPLGQCIPFDSCTPLYNLVNSGQQLNPDEYNLIVKSYCDPLNGVQRICCQMSDINENINSPTRQDFAMDLTTHANARLINSNQCGESSNDRIAYGLATDLFEFPWMALIRTVHEDNQFLVICGGSLISIRYVLTAAHCMQTLRGPIPIHSVVLGDHNTETNPDCNDVSCADPIQEIPIEQQIPHPQFTIATAKNDIGLLRLSQDAQLSYSVVPICLPITPKSQNVELNQIILTGWGTTENDVPSTLLLKTILDVTAESECKLIYKSRFNSRITVDSTTLCAYDAQSGSCSGDSGGPAVFIGSTDQLGPRMFQYGIVSAGTNTCGANRGVPGLYTRVATYMQWILDNISD